MKVSSTRGLAALALAAATVAVAAGPAAAQRRHEPTGPDSFLEYQVESTDELVDVLRTNPTLRRRYARHFGVPESKAVDFVRRALVPHRLTESRDVTVYGVTKSGRIYPVRTRLRKGTRVWANRSGKPILKWLCANPMTRALPGENVLPPRPARRVAANGRVRALPMQPGEVAPLPSELLALATPTGEIPVVSGGGAAVLPGVPAVPTTEVAGSVATIGTLGGGGIGALPLLAAIPLAFNGGGGGDRIAPPVEVIPEPGTAGLLAATSVPLFSLALRRRKRH